MGIYKINKTEKGFNVASSTGFWQLEGPNKYIQEEIKRLNGGKEYNGQVKKKLNFVWGSLKAKQNGSVIHGTSSHHLSNNTLIHEIMIAEDSTEIGDTIIHELIHASLRDIILDENIGDNVGEALIKLAKKANRNEEFVDRLSRKLSENIKLAIKQTSVSDSRGERW